MLPLLVGLRRRTGGGKWHSKARKLGSNCRDLRNPRLSPREAEGEGVMAIARARGRESLRRVPLQVSHH
jgi:hypothetical protein